MTTLVKIHRNGQMTLPSSFGTAMGVGKGCMVELSLKNGKAVITPKVAIDRSQFPNADDEYTPAQRRIIDARLDKSEKDFKAGRFHGPFTAKEASVYIERLAKERAAAAKQTNRPRR